MTNSALLRDIEAHPTCWVLECPKCGSLVNAQYALALSPILGATTLPHFYCPCGRFQIMSPRPSKVASRQTLLVLYSLLVTLTNYSLRRTRIWARI